MTSKLGRNVMDEVRIDIQDQLIENISGKVRGGVWDEGWNEVGDEVKNEVSKDVWEKLAGLTGRWT